MFKIKSYFFYLKTVFLIIGGIALLAVAIDGFKISWDTLYLDEAIKLQINDLLLKKIHPALFLFPGILITSFMQSSSASIALAISAAAGGAMHFDSAVYFILGANVGTSLVNSIVSLNYAKSDIKFKRTIPSVLIDDQYKLLNTTLFFLLELLFGTLSQLSHRATDFLSQMSSIDFAMHLQLEAFTLFILKPIQSALIHFLPTEATALILFILSLSCLQIAVRLFGKATKESIDKFFSKNSFKIIEKSAVSFAIGFVVCWLLQSSSLTLSLILPVVAEVGIKLQSIYFYSLGASLATTCAPAQLFAYYKFGALGIQLGLVHIILNLFSVSIFGLLPWTRHLVIRYTEFLSRIIYEGKRPAINLLTYMALVYFIIPGLFIYFFT